MSKFLSSISVILPVYNGEKYIKEAINSVFNQSVDVTEIIVIDDGSTDNTKNIVKVIGRNVRYLYQSNRGPAAARNHGLKEAKGEFITFIDYDDIWLENKLGIQTEIFLSDPSIEMVLGLLQITPMNNSSLMDVVPENSKGKFALQLGTSLIRKSVFDLIGDFDEGLFISDDTDWFHRAIEEGVKAHIHRDIVQLYRAHDKNITNDKILTNKYVLKAFKKSLDRRRKEGDTKVSKIPGFGNLDEIIDYLNKE